MFYSFIYSLHTKKVRKMIRNGLFFFFFFFFENKQLSKFISTEKGQNGWCKLKQTSI